MPDIWAEIVQPSKAAALPTSLEACEQTILVHHVRNWKFSSVYLNKSR